MNRPSLRFLLARLCAVAALCSATAHADTLTSGVARIDYDQSAWEALASGFGTPPVLTLSAFFDQAAANALPQSNLLADAQSSPSYTNQLYAMNGPVVTNLPTRFTQPTTFAYTPGGLTQHTGSIGLGGVTRFAVYGGVAGNLLYGDFTLGYDTNRFAFGGSGWHLYGNIPPAATAFDLLNVTITEAPGTFTITADVCVSFEVANFLYGTPGDTLADVGNFTFTAHTRQHPILKSFVSADAGALVVLGTNGPAGVTYAVLTSTNLALPVSSWTTNATGTFGANGTFSNSLPADSAAGFLLLRTP